MKVLSLFSGGGLGDYGLELAGMEIVGQVEIDEYCQKILKLRWPEVPKWKDIREVRGEEVISTVGRIDLISGGFPCQDISTAGKGAGITGERSGLWKEMFRLIREIRPKYVLVENVTALLGRGLGVVLGDVAEIGYDCEWDCIPASAIGAHHQRDRIWIIAYHENKNVRLPIGTKTEITEFRINGNDVANTQSQQNWRLFQRRFFTNPRTNHKMGNPSIKRLPDWAGGTVGQPSPLTEFERPGGREIELDFRGVAHGVANRVDRLKLLGNGQVVQVVEWIGKQIMEFDRDGVKVTFEEEK